MMKKQNLCVFCMLYFFCMSEIFSLKVYNNNRHNRTHKLDRNLINVNKISDSKLYGSKNSLKNTKQIMVKNEFCNLERYEKSSEFKKSQNNKEEYQEGFDVVRSTGITFDNIGGYQRVKDELYQIVDILKNYKKYKKFNVDVPKGIIFNGPPGTGKTFFAKALAEESKCTFISVSGPDFVQKYIGEGSKKIKKLFDFAKKNLPTIIFIDEIDSIARSRSSSSESATAERDNILNSLLIEIDGFKNTNGIFVIGATNRIDIIDSALLRAGRLDKQIYFGLPDLSARIQIIDMYIQGKPHDKSIKINYLGEMFEQMTGSQIKNILNEAMLNALKNKREIMEMSDIEYVYDKIFVGWNAIDHKFSKETIEKIAVHEIGHGLMGTIVRNHPKLIKMTINLSSPKSPGYTRFENSLCDFDTKESLVGSMMVLLSGRIAEEIIFGKSITTGSYDDIQKVLEIATNMVERYGMGKRILYPTNSEKYKSMLDDDIYNLVNSIEEVSKIILNDCRHLIKAMCPILLELKSIDYDVLNSFIQEFYDRHLQKIKIMDDFYIEINSLILKNELVLEKI